MVKTQTTRTGCQAKNPATCRFHGVNGELTILRKQIRQAVAEQDPIKYLRLREKYKKLEDQEQKDTRKLEFVQVALKQNSEQYASPKTYLNVSQVIQEVNVFETKPDPQPFYPDPRLKLSDGNKKIMSSIESYLKIFGYTTEFKNQGVYVSGKHGYASLVGETSEGVILHVTQRDSIVEEGDMKRMGFIPDPRDELLTKSTRWYYVVDGEREYRAKRINNLTQVL